VATRGLPAGDQRRLSAGARRAIVTSPGPGDFNLTTFGDAFARRTAAALPLCAIGDSVKLGALSSRRERRGAGTGLSQVALDGGRVKLDSQLIGGREVSRACCRS